MKDSKEINIICEKYDHDITSILIFAYIKTVTKIIILTTNWSSKINKVITKLIPYCIPITMQSNLPNKF